MWRPTAPGKVSYGSAGQGSLTHLTMELYKQQFNSFMVHFPYRGIAPAFTDLIGGQTQAMFPGLAAAVPHIRSGRVRLLAVTGLQRHPQYKEKFGEFIVADIARWTKLAHERGIQFDS